MMYVGCPSYYDDVGRGILTAEQEREVLEKHPPFDPHTTRSARSHGILVEFFRTFPGTSSITTSRASRPPARTPRISGRASVGFRLWGWFTARQISRRSAESILLLGSDHDEVTFLHHVEHVVDFPDKKISRYKVPCEDGGRVVWRDVRGSDYRRRRCARELGRIGFSRTSSTAYLEEQRQFRRRVGHANSYLIPARDLYSFAGPLMQERRDPTSLDPRCSDLKAILTASL